MQNLIVLLTNWTPQKAINQPFPFYLVSRSLVINSSVGSPAAGTSGTGFDVAARSVHDLVNSAAADLRKSAADRGLAPAFIEWMVTEYQLWFPFIFGRLIDQAVEPDNGFDPDWAKKILGIVFMELVLQKHDGSYVPASGLPKFH